MNIWAMFHIMKKKLIGLKLREFLPAYFERTSFGKKNTDTKEEVKIRDGRPAPQSAFDFCWFAGVSWVECYKII